MKIHLQHHTLQMSLKHLLQMLKSSHLLHHFLLVKYELKCSLEGSVYE